MAVSRFVRPLTRWQREQMLAGLCARGGAQELEALERWLASEPHWGLAAMGPCVRHGWIQGLEVAWRHHPRDAALEAGWRAAASHLDTQHPTLAWLMEATVRQRGHRARLAALSYALGRADSRLWSHLLAELPDTALKGAGAARLLVGLLERLPCWPSPTVAPRSRVAAWVAQQALPEVLARGVEANGSVWFTAARQQGRGAQEVWDLLLEHVAQVATPRRRAVLLALAPHLRLPPERLCQMVTRLLQAGTPVRLAVGWGAHTPGESDQRLAKLAGMQRSDLTSGMAFYRVDRLDRALDAQGVLDVEASWESAGSARDRPAWRAKWRALLLGAGLNQLPPTPRRGPRL